MEKQGKFNEMRRWKKVETIICVIFFLNLLKNGNDARTKKKKKRKATKLKRKI